MYKILAIMGEAGTGKDTLMQSVLTTNPSLHEIISCTTRPKREGEKEGVNYYYYTPNKFNNKIIKNEMLEYTIFNNWYYGTSYDSVKEDCINIGVFNPAGVRSILSRSDVDVAVVYVRTADKTRLLRQLNREKNPNVEEIIRRFKTDIEDFSELDFKYCELTNETSEDLNKNVREVLNLIETRFALGQ